MPASPPETMGRYLVGVDIGGTFTDLVSYDSASGEMKLAKVPSTPRAIQEAVVRGFSRLGFDLSEVAQIVHGSTVGSNTAIQRRGARTGLISTDGFGDELEIQEAWRKRQPYNILYEKATPLIPRQLRIGLSERLDYRGRVLRTLSRREVVKAVSKLREMKVESIAVCLLWSFMNPAHEEGVLRLIKKHLPGVRVSLSSAVAPEIREYRRMSTTVVDAYIAPVIENYLNAMEANFRRRGFAGRFSVVRSSGGTMTAEIAMRKPVQMIESGPAAGVVAATYLGMLSGHSDIISFDMGGTTAKACLIEKGAARTTTEFEINEMYPIALPMLDVVEIGSGGGSVAWLDPAGALRVGPQSAGAEPGPACYMRGGAEPTVTDAYVVLGYIDPNRFLGGEMKLDREAASSAIRSKIANPLRMTPEQAAMGIYRIATQNMLHATRLVSIEKGYDPRSFVLVGFGGAGPMHAAHIGAELPVSRIVVPVMPALFSALGMLTTEVRDEASKSYPKAHADVELEDLRGTLGGLESSVRSSLREQGLDDRSVEIVRQADMRYLGQSFEIRTEIPQRELTSKDLESMASTFHTEHQRIYNYSIERHPIEFVTLRVLGIGKKPEVKLKAIKDGGAQPPAEALLGSRRVYMAPGDFVDAEVFKREELECANIIAGPAIIEELSSTTLVPQKMRAEIDTYGSIIITGSGREAR